MYIVRKYLYRNYKDDTCIGIEKTMGLENDSWEKRKK